MARIKTVTRTKISPVVDKAQTKRNIKVGKTAAMKAPRSLYFFQETPREAKPLRAYYMALIIAQVGAMAANKPFKLWPGGNVSDHVRKGRMKKADAPGMYVLTPSGVTYFENDEAKKPEKETLAAMLKAVKQGERPAFHKKELSEFVLNS